MVDTFTCDSCGRGSIAKTEQHQLLHKNTVRGNDQTTGKPTITTVTEGMDICPSCWTDGIIRSHPLTGNETEKKSFNWAPRADKQKNYVWGQDRDKDGKK